MNEDMQNKDMCFEGNPLWVTCVLYIC